MHQVVPLRLTAAIAVAAFLLGLVLAVALLLRPLPAAAEPAPQGVPVGLLRTTDGTVLQQRTVWITRHAASGSAPVPVADLASFGRLVPPRR